MGKVDAAIHFALARPRPKFPEDVDLGCWLRARLRVGRRCGTRREADWSRFLGGNDRNRAKKVSGNRISAGRRAKSSFSRWRVRWRSRELRVASSLESGAGNE